MTRLRHRIHIQQNTPVQDAAGQPVEAWSTYWRGWGNVIDVAGDEGGTDPQESIVKSMIDIPYPRKGRVPSPVDRVLYAENRVTRTLNISYVQRLDRGRRMLRLFFREVQT